MSPTDMLLARIEELRPVLDSATGRVGVQVRAILVDGTIKVTSTVKQMDEREQR